MGTIILTGISAYLQWYGYFEDFLELHHLIIIRFLQRKCSLCILDRTDTTCIHLNSSRFFRQKSKF